MKKLKKNQFNQNKDISDEASNNDFNKLESSDTSI